jgi:quinol monooxygenase YgiN
MAKLALLARLDVKPGKEREVEELLRSALPLAVAEPGTRSWFALKMAPEIYGIFDTFDDEAGRNAHLSGKIAAALLEKSSELLSRPPVIEKVEILAAKNG